MDEKLLKRALAEDSEKLYDILDISYALRKVEYSELKEIAEKTNQNLGYELFHDIENTNLSRDFSLVTRALTKRALGIKD